MVEAFIGKWVVDLSATAGIDEYAAAMGSSQEKLDKYKSLSYSIEFSTSGDSHVCILEFPELGIPPMTYPFQIGDTIDYRPMGGEVGKLTVTLDGGKMVEHFIQEDNKSEWTTTREVDGDTMIAITTAAGKSVVQKLKKV